MNRFAVHLFVMFVTSGACSLVSAVLSAAEPTSTGWTPEAMLHLKRVGTVQVSPDGKLAAYTVRRPIVEEGKSEYLTQIYLATVDGQRTWQLTQGDKSCDEPQWSPKGETIAFISSRSGKANVWLIRASGGEAQRLTDLASDVSSLLWSPDGRSIACTALDPQTDKEKAASRDKNDPRVIDENIKRLRLYVVPVSDRVQMPTVPRPLTSGDVNVASDSTRPGRAAYDWSPDGKTIAFSHTRTPNADDWTTADLSVVDVASGKVLPLLHSLAAETSPRYSPDGRLLAFLQSDSPASWGGRRKIHVVPATGGSPRALADTADDFGRYSELVGWSADGAQVYYSELQRTEWKLLAMPLDGVPVEITRGGGMSTSGAALNATRTAFGYSWDSLNKPSEALVSPVDRFEPIQVSHVNDNPFAPNFPRTEVIRWKSTESLEIEGLLTYPTSYTAGQRYPLLLVIHGGPMGAFTQTCDATPGTYPVAAFAARGYALLRANIRGSSGYGAKFRFANYGDWGGGDYRDLLAGVDHVISLGIADADRLGVMGWSYGGFMTSWTITQTKRFRAASVGAGVTNLVSFTGTSDIPGFLPDYFGTEFWNQLEPYRAHSPMFQVQGVRTPTLIQHGERDERVPLSQGQELYNALKRQGCTTQMIVYPRTPHGIEEPRLLLDCMQRNLQWFDKYVREAKSASGS